MTAETLSLSLKECFTNQVLLKSHLANKEPSGDTVKYKLPLTVWDSVLKGIQSSRKKLRGPDPAVRLSPNVMCN